MEYKGVITTELFEMRDSTYADFEARLIPTVERALIIGVRAPALRKYAKEIAGTTAANEFMQALPHMYLEENSLHAILISRMRDYNAALIAVNAFLPYVDNWATCDVMSPKVFAKHTDKLYPQIVEWVSSRHTYTIRFGLEMLMSFYLGEHFDREQLRLASTVSDDEYYVYMMIAWYFATALAKQYDATIQYIENRLLNPHTHNKTIQKAVESFRISDEQKAYLRTLRVKPQPADRRGQ